MKYKLISITTNKFNFKNKLLDGKEYTLKPIFNRNILKIDNKYSLTLSVSIHDYENSISPYDIDLSIDGTYFKRENALSLVPISSVDLLEISNISHSGWLLKNAV